MFKQSKQEGMPWALASGSIKDPNVWLIFVPTACSWNTHVAVRLGLFCSAKKWSFILHDFKKVFMVSKENMAIFPSQIFKLHTSRLGSESLLDPWSTRDSTCDAQADRRSDHSLPRRRRTSTARGRPQAHRNQHSWVHWVPSGQTSTIQQKHRELQVQWCQPKPPNWSRETPRKGLKRPPERSTNKGCSWSIPFANAVKAKDPPKGHWLKLWVEPMT